MVEEEGGLFLQETINVALSPNAGFYTGAGGWKMSTFQGLIALGWDWKLAHDGVVITGEELIKNDGFSDAIVSLIQARVDVTSLTLPDLMGTYLFRNNPYGTNIDGTVERLFVVERRAERRTPSSRPRSITRAP